MTASPVAPPHDPTAVGGRRIAAAVIDVGLGWVIWFVIFFALSKRAPGYLQLRDVCPTRSCMNVGHRYVTDGGRLVVWGAFWLYLFLTCVVQRGLTGRTLGTSILDITTVDADGQPLGVGMALVRSLAGAVDYLPCCFPVVGFVMVLIGSHRRVGDLAARSYVVRREDAGRPLAIAGAPPPAPPAPPPAPGPTPGPTPSPGPAFPGDAASVAPPATPPTVEASTPPDPTQPQWDPARNAYIQWDPVGRRWMQFDQATQTWQVMSS
ncbi:MAG TPA: RDD family protein [Acidimicrobiales bacterium]|nr:RDD family protein [Acidimicrobiales bacterium]